MQMLTQFLILGAKARALVRGRPHVAVEDIRAAMAPGLVSSAALRRLLTGAGFTDVDVVSRSIFALVSDMDRMYFGGDESQDQIGFLGGAGKPADESTVATDTAIIRRAYTAKSAGESFVVRTGAAKGAIADVLERWLR